MRYAKIGMLGLLAASLCGGSAMAQQAYTYQALNNAMLSRQGRPPTDNLTLSVKEIYDSNVLGLSASAAAAQGFHSRSDWITEPFAGVNIVVPLGVTQFFAGGEIGYDFYAKHHNFDRLDAQLAAGVTTHFVCDDSLVGNLDTVHNNASIAPGLDIKNSQAVGQIHADVRCGQKYGLAPSFGVGERWAVNSDKFFAVANNRTFSAHAGLAWNTPVLGSVGVFGEFDDTTFTDSTFNVGGVNYRNGFYVYSVGGRYEKIGHIFDFTAQVGYTKVSEKIPGTINYSGLSYALDVQYHASPRLIGHVLLTRAAIPSDLPYATLGIESTYDVGASFVASHMLQFGLDGQIAHTNYRGAPLINSLVVNTVTDYSVRGTARVLLSPRFQITFGAEERHRDTDVSGFSYWATIISAAFSARFGS